MLFISFSCTKINDEESINAVKSSNTENGISKLYNETATKQIKGRSDFFTSQSNQMKLSGGEFIYGDDWTGWIDPALVGNFPIDEQDLERGEAVYWGQKIKFPDGSSGIVCPKEGKKCGVIYIVNDTGYHKIGWYLIED
jgi:hypothetical protein